MVRQQVAPTAIPQLGGTDLTTCIEDASPTAVNPETGEGVHGWCYVDGLIYANADPANFTGCGSAPPRIVRFVGDGGQVSGSDLIITCSGEN